MEQRVPFVICAVTLQINGLFCHGLAGLPQLRGRFDMKCPTKAGAGHHQPRVITVVPQPDVFGGEENSIC